MPRTTDPAKERRVRSMAKQWGFRVEKSRGAQHSNQRGEYQMIGARNCVVLGVDYDASLDDIIDYFRFLHVSEFRARDRTKYIISQALMCAIKFIDQMPPDMRPVSDRDDMVRLLTADYPDFVEIAHKICDANGSLTH